MDKKYNLLKTACRITDLGAAPGSWTEVARQRTPSTSNIVAVDLLEMDSSLMDGSVNFVQGDFLSLECQDRVKAALGNNQADLILSDMVSSREGTESFPPLTHLPTSWRIHQALV